MHSIEFNGSMPISGERIAVEGTSLLQVLEEIERRNESLQGMLLTNDRLIPSYLRIFTNGSLVTEASDLLSTLPPRTEITVINAVSGG